MPGDEVLIPEPSFVCYKPDTELAGGVAVPLETKEEHNFALMPDTLRAAITPRTKALVLPYPNNPTGGIMTKREVEAIAEVLEGTNILVISDEIYAELTYGGARHFSIAQIPSMKERTVIVSGFFKGVRHDRVAAWLCLRAAGTYCRDDENSPVCNHERAHNEPVRGHCRPARRRRGY